MTQGRDETKKKKKRKRKMTRARAIRPRSVGLEDLEKSTHEEI